MKPAEVPKSPRLTAHSFRHTVSEALRVSEAPFHLQRRLLGHASRDESDIYGAKSGRLIDLADTLRAALPHLGEVDDGEYRDDELIE